MLATAAAVVAFRAAHQRKPRTGEGREEDEETRLAKWLSMRRRDLTRSSLNSEVECVLEAQLPGWRDEPEVVRGRQEAWQEMLGGCSASCVSSAGQKETAEGAAVGMWLD